jgi:hypothetical protein
MNTYLLKAYLLPLMAACSAIHEAHQSKTLNNRVLHVQKKWLQFLLLYLARNNITEIDNQMQGIKYAYSLKPYPDSGGILNRKNSARQSKR